MCSGPIRSCGQLPGPGPGPTTTWGNSIYYNQDSKPKPIQARLLFQSTACIHKPRGTLTAFKRLPGMWDDEDNSIPSPALPLLALPHLTHYPLQIPMAPLSAVTPKHPKSHLLPASIALPPHPQADPPPTLPATSPVLPSLAMKTSRRQLPLGHQRSSRRKEATTVE